MYISFDCGKYGKHAYLSIDYENRKYFPDKELSVFSTFTAAYYYCYYIYTNFYK